jgi:hypothetical protein
MDRPSWDRLEAWARAEAARYLDVGLEPHPTVVFFEGEEPTMYVRAGARYATGHRADAPSPWQELFAMGMVVHPERAALVAPIRLRTDDDGADLGEAEGEAAVAIDWIRRRDDGSHDRGGAALPYGLDDRGAVRWGEREEFPEGGPMGQFLTATVTGRWFTQDDRAGAPEGIDMGPAEMAYAFTRFGFVLGVARDWWERYGLDEPIAPEKVRPEDRRRARRRWDARRRVAEVRS